jgi:tetrahydromethanopterin S-methyltransferase subunit B
MHNNALDQLLADLRSLMEMGAPALLNGHRPDAELLLVRYQDCPLPDEDEERTPEEEEVDRLGKELWDILEPIGQELRDILEPMDAPPVVEPEGWAAEVEALLLEHWGDFAAFDVEIEERDHESGFKVVHCVPGAAVTAAGRLEMQAEFIDWKSLPKAQVLELEVLECWLLNHMDPKGELLKTRWERLGLAQKLPLPASVFEPGLIPVEEFKAELALRRMGVTTNGKWLVGENKGQRVPATDFLLLQTGQHPLLLERQKSLKAAADAVDAASVTVVAQARPFQEILNDLYEAVVDDELDEEMRFRRELWDSYRLNDEKADRRLFRLLKSKALGFSPTQTKRKRRGVSFKSIKGTDWKLPGFLPANDITLLWGMRGAGKTRLALEMAMALMNGTGLLDRSAKAEPCKVLFMASDSGGDPLREELQAMGLDPDDDELFSEDRWELWCHSTEEQQEAWGCDMRGRIELYEWAKENKGAVVIMDSAKTISTKGGISYADNTETQEFMTFLKECIAPLVTVMVIAHDGTRSDRAGGAAAWEEIPSMVIGVKRPKGEDGKEETHCRLLTVYKCRKADERSFFYSIDEGGRLKLALGTLVIADVSGQIVEHMRDQFDAGVTKLSVEEIQQGVQALRGGMVELQTIRNNLSNLVRGTTPKLKRVPGRRGLYKLNPYWLRSN